MLGNDGLWYKADADVIEEKPTLGLAVEGISPPRAGQVLLFGLLRYNDWNWTRGKILYASETPGEMTHVCPSVPGYYVPEVGVAFTKNAVFFNPRRIKEEIKAVDVLPPVDAENYNKVVLLTVDSSLYICVPP